MVSRPVVERQLFVRWTLLTAIAFGGSAFYGASLAHAIPGWQLWRGALWLTASAGFGWILLGPALIYFTKQKPFALADACLVAMAWGEAVLFLGGLANFLLTSLPAGPTSFNAIVVGISNVAMVSILASRLGRLGVSFRTTLTLWFLVLDGGGALAFWVLYGVLFR